MIEDQFYTLADIRDYVFASNTRIGGIILYDQTHANIHKVLKDVDYRLCFHKLSGKNWPVFYPSFKNEDASVSNSESIHRVEDVILNADDSCNFISWLSINANKDLPCFVLIGWDDEDNICVYTYPLQDKTIDAASLLSRKSGLIGL